ncbi:hypothetical protein [Corynebacterium oculi]|uniref:Matrixin n=1 Tax=Corynebacterium oculi TaxID=1544416 RepID=A0A0Q0YPU6_9CORY|nr:hypothetical protein [Corynebacterium oculi]KQB84479.1 hypothetical protein Cocul_01281 [Corynebacterium oculi]
MYYGDTQFGAAVDKAIENWTEASNGAIKIVKVDQPTEHSIEIVDRYSGNFGQFTLTPSPRLYLSKNRLKTADMANQAFVVGHELGHAMGLSHGCDDTIMRDLRTFGTSSLVPTAVDVAAVRQGNF